MRPAALAALALLVGGCAQAPESEAAQREVERRARDARVSCTDRSVRWFREGPPAEVFICVARRDHGHCDRYVVRREGERFAARRTEADTVDCALPVG